MRQYSHNHYTNNPVYYKEKARTHDLAYRARVQTYLANYLFEHPCIDCGEDNIVVLEFDHREDKKFAIGMALTMGYGLPKIVAEVAKCDIRCANCHRIKTSQEGSQWRSMVALGMQLQSKRKPRG